MAAMLTTVILGIAMEEVNAPKLDRIKINSSSVKNLKQWQPHHL